ncbi:hypothetical protein PYH37_005578 [Sinorhizobium numidicum]|uniref:Transmembrane protein n=1 Tax=Sinorhizobium numidicum TaxID=680248 RepID=A0ABY8CYX8_9HYPH|nr:hypothetical protein [Sinorhizobium numidicum]WEX77190.1 hypothetical protein PYH37_005578 [Sinorhizobium numidicum]WEX83849.1 hypothetical protein PYH38_002671 [Sinorhizobium numidicum]
MPLHSDRPNGRSTAGDGSAVAGGASAGAASAAARGIADWLSLAAAPTFAIMALLTAATGGADMICSSTQDASPLNGMVPMYLLMAAFHSAPWLKLVSSRGQKMERSIV